MLTSMVARSTPDPVSVISKTMSSSTGLSMELGGGDSFAIVGAVASSVVKDQENGVMALAPVTSA
jgi:hypothetical protein